MYINKNIDTTFCLCNHNHLTRFSLNSGMIIPKIAKSINLTDLYYKGRFNIGQNNMVRSDDI